MLASVFTLSGFIVCALAVSLVGGEPTDDKPTDEPTDKPCEVIKYSPDAFNDHCGSEVGITGRDQGKVHILDGEERCTVVKGESNFSVGCGQICATSFVACGLVCSSDPAKMWDSSAATSYYLSAKCW